MTGVVVAAAVLGLLGLALLALHVAYPDPDAPPTAGGERAGWTHEAGWVAAGLVLAVPYALVWAYDARYGRPDADWTGAIVVHGLAGLGLLMAFRSRERTLNVGVGVAVAGVVWLVLGLAGGFLVWFDAVGS